MQSNQIHTTIAVVRKVGVAARIQLEHQGSVWKTEYKSGVNVVLMKTMDVTIHHYEAGEDEDGADNNLYEFAWLFGICSGRRRKSVAGLFTVEFVRRHHRSC